MAPQQCWRVAGRDPNATACYTAPDADPVGGLWFSRWNGGADPTIPGDEAEKWKTGWAEMRAIGDRVYIHFTWDNNGARRGLIEAKREGPKRLVGKYINVTDPKVARPWIGLIVDNERIDGRWVSGRLDFSLRRSRIRPNDGSGGRSSYSATRLRPNVLFRANTDDGGRMTVNSYEEAMDDALDRLRAVGFEQVGGFPSHASMAAEAFAALGYYDQVADWVEWNKHHRAYTDEPVPTNLILADDEDAWRPALGVTGRAADWSAMFEREIAEHGWREVLATWWPRLLPGVIGGLTHGLIRTAHAVRGVTRAQPPSALQLRELAHGLGLWAAVFTTLTPSSDRPEQNEDGPLTPEGVQGALSDLTSANAGIYTASRSPNPVPLVHVITAPAAVRLVLPSVPTHLHEVSYRTIAQVTQTLIARFAAPLLSSDVPLPGPGAGELTPEILKAEAAELGDEHVIKLAEAADREYSLRPDPRYLRASWALNQRMKGSPPESWFGGRQL